MLLFFSEGWLLPVVSVLTCWCIEEFEVVEDSGVEADDIIAGDELIHARALLLLDPESLKDFHLKLVAYPPHSNFFLEQFKQEGLVSSHLSLFFLHVRQPFLDLGPRLLCVSITSLSLLIFLFISLYFSG